MNTPLEQLMTSGAVQRVTEGAIDGFIAHGGPSVLLFTGDPAQRPEAQDIAVVARELVRQVPNLFVGVVPFVDEPALKPRFNVTAVPTVIFMKDGRPISTVSRLQEWTVYSRTANVVFGRRPEVKS